MSDAISRADKSRLVLDYAEDWMSILFRARFNA
jgi:hypothetical protein